MNNTAPITAATATTATPNNQTNVMRYVGEKNTKQQKHGIGTMYYSATAYYSGGWKDDQMHGKGEYCWGDGHKYVGHFEHGKQHGKGVYTWPTGGQYSGNWKQDKMNGFGRYVRNDGVVYVGVWKDDHQFGMGIKIVPERVCYGEKREMFRKRKYREIWSTERKLVFHREIIEYPDIWKVWNKKSFFDVDFVFESEATTVSSLSSSTITIEDITESTAQV